MEKMTANELADYLDNNIEAMIMSEQPYLDQAATMLRQQQVKIEALKKRCLDEIFNRTYADRSAEVMCDYWELAQAEVEKLKLQLEYMFKQEIKNAEVIK